jgi:hypothetical protein
MLIAVQPSCHHRSCMLLSPTPTFSLASPSRGADAVPSLSTPFSLPRRCSAKRIGPAPSAPLMALRLTAEAASACTAPPLCYSSCAPPCTAGCSPRVSRHGRLGSLPSVVRARSPLTLASGYKIPKAPHSISPQAAKEDERIGIELGMPGAPSTLSPWTTTSCARLATNVEEPEPPLVNTEPEPHRSGAPHRHYPRHTGSVTPSPPRVNLQPMPSPQGAMPTRSCFSPRTPSSRLQPHHELLLPSAEGAMYTFDTTSPCSAAAPTRASVQLHQVKTGRLPHPHRCRPATTAAGHGNASSSFP